MNHQDLHFDLEALIAVMGEPIATSDFDRQYFRFSYSAHPERRVTLSVSKYERRAGLVVESTSGSCLVSIEQADSVRVLEAERKTLELVSTDLKTRCFVSLDGESVFNVEVGNLDVD